MYNEGINLTPEEHAIIKDKKIRSLEDLDVIALVSFEDSTARCLIDDPEVQNRLLKCLDISYEKTFHLIDDDPVSTSAVVFAFKKDDLVIYPTSRKPNGWTWGKLVEVMRATQLLPASPEINPKDRIYSHGFAAITQ